MTLSPPLAQQLGDYFAPPVLDHAFWAAILGVPVGIIILYFLKLRRRPIQVPSTLLWRRSLEDLHVNSLFQRLRRNLLLFLQLLAVGLAIFALLGPRMKGSATLGQRYVLTIDESASMAATDVNPSRLEQAKREVRKIIDSMRPEDLAMIIAFSDSARVVSSYTANKDLLKRRLDSIQPTQRSTSLREALQVAAGLANPSKQIGEGVVAASVVPPRLYLYTDGGFADVEDFSLGNLEPEIVVLGTPPPPPRDRSANSSAETVELPGHPSNNLAILALQAARNEEKPDQFQIFGRVRNYRGEPVQTEAKLLRHDPRNPGQPASLIDAVALQIDPRSDQAFSFDLPEQGELEIEVRIDFDDDLPMDNRAFTSFGSVRRARVLLVSDRNRYLQDTLATPAVDRLAEIARISSDQLKDDAVMRELAAGRYDLVIFDGVAPRTSPDANTLYFGALPPEIDADRSKPVDSPVILDWNVSHPLMQFIRDLPLVKVAKGTITELPTGGVPLIESDKGPIAWTAPRAGFQDTVIGFKLLDAAEFNTDWPVRFYSFPLFIFNALRTLGGARDLSGAEAYRPGQPVNIRADAAATEIEIIDPNGKSLGKIKRSVQGGFTVNETPIVGIYHARWGEGQGTSFAVNLFDERESDLATRGLVPPGVPETDAENYRIKIGFNPVKGTQRQIKAVQDWWKAAAIAALGVLLLEWYIYNRRVYI
jgi:hypothetical protein